MTTYTEIQLEEIENTRIAQLESKVESLQQQLTESYRR